MNDHDLLLTIQELLDGVVWTPDTVETIAELMTENGYRIRDKNDRDALATPPAPILYVLHIAHRHGDSYWVFDDEEKARNRLADWCRQWWERELESEPMPTSDGDLVVEYFAAMNERGESFTIEDVRLDSG